MQTRAAVVRQKGGPFTVEDVAIAEPAADQILVKIVAAGMCHTDLTIRDQNYETMLPMVLGHEGSGIVEKVGANVTKVKPGDHVVLTFHTCGHCHNCLAGHQLCTLWQPVGYGTVDLLSRFCSCLSILPLWAPCPSYPMPRRCCIFRTPS